VQDKESNKKYRNNELATNSNRYIRNVQLIIFVFNYKKLKRNRQLQRYIEAFVKLKR
jgi:hypothetical protein